MNHLLSWGVEVFRWVLQTTWQAAVLAGLILLAQWLLRKRMTPSWRHGLWLLLLARLLMPVSPPSAFSIFNLARSGSANPLAGAQPLAVSGDSPSFKIEPSEGVSKSTLPAANHKEKPDDPSVPASGGLIGPSSRIDGFLVAFYAWLTGVFFFATRLVWTNARFRARLARRQPVVDEEATRLFDECRANLKITRPVVLVESEEVESPGVYGFWRKWLLLPDGVFERFSSEELRHIFLHELAHIKRRDVEVNWLAALLQTLHWFNPVVWLAFARMRADRELATDALALARATGTENVAYGETILKVAANLSQRAVQTGLVGIAESKAGLQERMRAIAGFRMAKLWGWAGFGIAAIIAGVGMTGARQIPQSAAAEISNNSSSELKPMREISGRIVDPLGHPAVGAQVALSKRQSAAPSQMFPGSGLHIEVLQTGQPLLFNPDYPHSMSTVRQKSLAWNYCTTDAHGNFYLDDLDGAKELLVVHKGGFVRVPSNDFSTNMLVKLEFWGRVEGSVWHYNEPVTNTQVRILPNRDFDTPSMSDSKFEATTDDQGRYAVDFVPRGRFSVAAAGMLEVTQVKSGKTTIVKIGGSGRTLVGKFIIRDPDGKIDSDGKFQSDEGFRYMFSTKLPVPKDQTEEGMRAWAKRPEAEKEYARIHMRPVECAKDGSFHIDQVVPGDYLLTAGNYRFMEPFGYHEFNVPETDSGNHEPLDFGVIEISLKRPPYSDRIKDKQ